MELLPYILKWVIWSWHMALFLLVWLGKGTEVSCGAQSCKVWSQHREDISACKTVEAAAEEAGHCGWGTKERCPCWKQWGEMDRGHQPTWLRGSSVLRFSLGETHVVPLASCIHWHKVLPQPTGKFNVSFSTSGHWNLHSVFQKPSMLLSYLKIITYLCSGP